MREKDIQSVIETMGKDNVQATKLHEEGYSKGVWFIFEAGLLPPQNEIRDIICDIIEKRAKIWVSYDGIIRHADSCKEVEHILEPHIANCITNLKEQTCKIALWETSAGSKPFAFCLTQEISHSVFPNHPHINAGGEVEDGIYIPESICFIEELDEIGQKYPDKIINAISQIRLWIFRHNIWLASGLIGEPVWIGSSVDMDEKDQLMWYRDPSLKCRCGKNKPYRECHLISDYNVALKNNRIPLVRTLFNGHMIPTPMFTSQSGRFDIDKYTATFNYMETKKREAYNKINKLGA